MKHWTVLSIYLFLEDFADNILEDRRLVRKMFIEEFKSLYFKENSLFT